MDHATLDSLITALERGNKVHICVAFLDNCGNRKTKCTYSHVIHDRPVCMEIKSQAYGLASCYRCRSIVQKAVIRHRKSLAGVCKNGVYEYCRPVVYDERVICVIFVGNILTDDAAQRKKLEAWVAGEILETMEQSFSLEDCVNIADILESYIVFLFDHYGIDNKTFDPLVENIKNYIRENLSFEFSLKKLAADFNYTPKYLGRMFKAKTGQSIREYCNYTKVAQAKFLLSETDRPIEVIAAQVGFNSVTYFDRIFHKMTGITPQVYRGSTKKTRPERGRYR